MIRVNGQEEVLEEKLTIEDYISRHGYRTNRIAVEKKRNHRAQKKLCGHLARRWRPD